MLAIRLGFLLTTLVASLHVAAVPRFGTLTDVRFNDGTVATGYLSYDDTTQTISNWNVRVDPGLFSQPSPTFPATPRRPSSNRLARRHQGFASPPQCSSRKFGGGHENRAVVTCAEFVLVINSETARALGTGQRNDCCYARVKRFSNGVERQLLTRSQLLGHPGSVHFWLLDSFT